MTLADLIIKLSAEFGDQQQFLDALRSTAERLKDVQDAAGNSAKSIDAINSSAAQAASAVNALGAGTGPATQLLLTAGSAATGAGQALVLVGQAGLQAATGFTTAGGAAQGAAQNFNAAGAGAANAAQNITIMGAALSSLEFLANRLVIIKALNAVIGELSDVVGEMANSWQEAENMITRATGAIGDDLAKFDDSLANVLVHSVQTSEEVGTAMGKIASSLHMAAGQDLENLTTDLLNLSQVTGAAIGPLTDKVSALFKAFDLKPDQFHGTIEQMLAVAQATNTSVTTIVDDAQKFGPAFRTLGVPIEEVINLIGKLTDAGVNVPQTLNNMVLAMRFLAKEGADGLKDALGLLFEQIRRAPSEGQAFAIGAQTMGRASKDLVDAVLIGKIKIEDLNDTAAKSGTSLAQQALAMQTLSGQWQLIKNEVVAATKGFVTDELRSALADIRGTLEGIGVAAKFIDSEITNISGKKVDWKPVFEGFIDATNPVIHAIGVIKEALSGIKNRWDEGKQAIAVETQKDLTGQTTVKDLTSTVAPNIDEGTSAESHSAANKAALARLLAKSDLAREDYNILKRMVDEQARAFDSKNDTEFLNYELKYYNRVSSAATPTDRAYQVSNELNKEIQFDQKRGVATSDAKYQRSDDLETQKKLGGMDRFSALGDLGIGDPAKVQNQITVLATAFDFLTSKGVLSGAEISAAYDSMITKMIADVKAAGGAVSSNLADLKEYADIQNAIEHMNNVIGAKTLGVTTDKQAAGQVSIGQAALGSIQMGAAVGLNSDNDVMNSTIGLLQLEAKEAAATGHAFDDLKQYVLDFMVAQRQLASMNTEGAFRALGLPSPDDVTNYTSILKTAYDKIAEFAAANPGRVDDSQLNAAKIAELKKLVAEYQSAGKAVNDNWVFQMQDLQAKNAVILANVSSAIANLGVVTTKQANDQIALIEKNLAAIGQKYGAGSAEFLTASVAAYNKQIADLQKSGQAVSDSLVHSFDDAATKLQAKTMTIDQAYQKLGVESQQQVKNTMELLATALQKVDADTTASAFQKFQALTNYQAEYFKTAIEAGNDYNAKDAALNDVHLQMIKDHLAQTENLWKAATSAIGDAWHTVQNDMASGLIGLQDGTLKVRDAALKMGEDIEQILLKYIINNLILTQSHLRAVQDGFLKLFGAQSINPAAAITPNLAGAVTPNLATIQGGASNLLNQAPVLSQGVPQLSPGTAAAVGLDPAGANFQAQVEAAAAAWSSAVEDTCALETDTTAENSATETEAATSSSTELETAMTSGSSELEAAMSGGSAEVETALASGGAAAEANIDAAGAAFEAEAAGSGAEFSTAVGAAAGVHTTAVDTSAATHAAAVDSSAATHSTSVSGSALFHAVAVKAAALEHAIAVKLAAAGHSLAVAAAAVGHGIAVAAAAVGHAVAVAAAAAGHAVAVGAAALAHGLAVTGAALAHSVAVGAAALAHGIAVVGAAAAHGIAVGIAAIAHGIAVIFGGTTHAAVVTVGAGVASGELVAGGATAAAELIAGGAVGAIGSIVGGVVGGVISGVISGLIQGVMGIFGQQHENNVLGQIEQNTRASGIVLGVGADGDSISVRTKEVAQKIDAINSFNNGDLRTYLQNMNIDLDGILAALAHGANLNLSVDFGSVNSMLANIYNQLVIIGGTDSSILTAIQSGVTAASAHAGAGSSVSEDAVTRATAHRATADSADAASDSATAAVGASVAATASMNAIVATANHMAAQTNAFVDADHPQQTGNPISFGTPSTATTVTVGGGTYTSTPGSQTNTPTPTDQLPGYDAGTTSANAARPTNTGNGTTDALNSIWNMLTSGGDRFGDEGGGFLKTMGIDIDAFTGSLDTSKTKFGPGGISRESFNAAEGTQFSIKAYDDAITSTEQAILGSIVAREGTPLGQNGQFNDAQMADIKTKFLSEFMDWVTTQFEPNKSNYQQFLPGDDIGTAYDWRTNANATGQSYSGGIGAAAPALAVAAQLNEASTQVAASGLKMADALAYSAAAVTAVTQGTYKGGVGSSASNSLMDRLAAAANQVSQVTEVMAPSSGTDYSLNAFNALSSPGAARWTININGANFPAGMKPQDVTDSLVRSMQQAGLGR